MRSRTFLAACIGLFAAIVLSAQTAAPNASGVFAAHTHLNTMDIPASTVFWSAIGGEATQIGTMNGVRIPGLYILFQMNRGRGGRAGAPGAPGAPPAGAADAGSPTAAPPQAPAPPASSEGSVVDAIGIKERNLADALTRLAAIGVRPLPGATPTTAVVLSPERVRVSLSEDPSIATSSAANEWLLKVPDPHEAAAWYQKWFGATVIAQGDDATARVPGMNLHFVRTSAPLAGTRGRALDHIGFDVIDLPALVTRMQAEGVSVATPYRTISLGFLTGLSFVTDPWGTYIELNQGYDGH